MLPKEFGSGSTCHRRFQQWVQMDILKKIWAKLLEDYDNKIGIKLIWQSLDSISINSPLVGTRLMEAVLLMQKQTGQAKRHILTDKQGIPLSTVISSASTHDIKLVTDVIDNSVIKRTFVSSKPKKGMKQRGGVSSPICLDRAYQSKPIKQEIIKRGYVPHIPYKRKRGQMIKNTNQKRYYPSKNKRWVVSERMNFWHNRFRKLFTRYEKKVEENYLGLVHLSWSIIIYRKIILR
jgi:transposase